MTVTALLDVRFDPARRDEGLAFLHTVLTDTRSFAGCLSVEVLVDTDDPAHVLVVERWESMYHDAMYRDWRAGAGATALGDYLAGPPGLTKFTATGV
ncbi:putative quinol monooxygenase [Nakamurella deserti]|uniref:putative quinol monooxygenase n=1 Tax=Nakamurella deserti TaxID=2164074 RepID=UPI000DBE8BF5|nr:antibiotic biosynthesis monooxygenase [Nakamurella deserti]